MWENDEGYVLLAQNSVDIYIEQIPLNCVQTGKHAGRNARLFFAINIQLLMTGRDNQRLSGELPH